MNAPLSARGPVAPSTSPSAARIVTGPVERIGSFVRNGQSVFVVQLWQDDERHVIDPLSLVGAGMAGARESLFAMLSVLRPGERLELEYSELEGASRCVAVRSLPVSGGSTS